MRETEPPKEVQPNNETTPTPPPRQSRGPLFCGGKFLGIATFRFEVPTPEVKLTPGD